MAIAMREQTTKGNSVTSKPGSKAAIAQLPLLTNRQLNRALIARQFLHRRHDLPVEVVLEHLVGMQSQVPTDPFLGLWTRLADFNPTELDTLMLERKAVRIGIMRGTIHVVTARDALYLRPLTQEIYERISSAQPAYKQNLLGIDMDLLIATGLEIFANQPSTGKAARERLREVFPDRDPDILTLVVRHLLPLVQVTPRGTWGASHAATYFTLDKWLNQPLESNPSVDNAILRYLRAFGPATVADIQTWSRLTGLRTHVDRLRPQLRSFRNERNQELFDVPDGLLPEDDLETPVRFLPEYDNILLSHADRSRIGSEELRAGMMSVNGRFLRTYLVDGFIHGFWDLRKGKGEEATTLAIKPLLHTPKSTRKAITEEAERLLAFLTPNVPSPTIHFED